MKCAAQFLLPLLLPVLLPAALVACTDTRAPITGTQSLRIELTAPTQTGDVNQRLPDTAHAVTVNVTALDERGNPDPSFTADVRAYAQFLGTLTPDLPEVPLATIHVEGGVATNQMLTLPNTVLGPTTLWFDDGLGVGRDYEPGTVTGTSPTLWFRDPFVADLQRPRDETGIDALTSTPLQNKQISVHTSRYGARGRLVVTSVFSQGYTVDDAQCADEAGTPPCISQAYDHALIFTFSAARDQVGHLLAIGQVIDRFTGGLSEFNGLTEIGFPRTYGPDVADVNPARVPPPVPFDLAWFGPLSMPTGMINFERNEAGAISVAGAVVCPIGPEYMTYKQWKIDPSGMGGAVCNGNKVLSIITAGTDFTTDPATLVGRKITRLVGILRPVSIGSFNVWILFPRGATDLTL